MLSDSLIQPNSSSATFFTTNAGSDSNLALSALFDPTNVDIFRSSSLNATKPPNGIFTVGRSGQVELDYILDGGAFEGELAVFSLSGLNNTLSANDLIQEAARRALSNSELGYVAISDQTEAAKFYGAFPGDRQDWNTGIYQGIKTLNLRPGDQFGLMLVPNGTVQEVLSDPSKLGDRRPLLSFSLDSANPTQFADLTGDDSLFAFEDLDLKTGSDRDYNDLSFQIIGATGTAATLDGLKIKHHQDWQKTSLGKEIQDYIETRLLQETISLQDISSGVFTVDSTGQVGIDYLFDGGGYNGQLAIFSLEGLDQHDWKVVDLIQEAARRALSSSELGHVVIADRDEGARFSAKLPWESDFNEGIYGGVKTFSMKAGSQFGVMLVPNATVQEVLNEPTSRGSVRPLFSIVSANPRDGFHLGQIADLTGDGNTFTMEDLRFDKGSDRDYNDIVFQVRGAIGQAGLLDDYINSYKDWRSTDIGQALVEYTKPYTNSANPKAGEKISQALLDSILVQPIGVSLPNHNGSSEGKPNIELPDFLVQTRAELGKIQQQQAQVLSQFEGELSQRTDTLSNIGSQLWESIYKSQQEIYQLLQSTKTSLDTTQADLNQLQTIVSTADNKLVTLVNNLFAQIKAAQDTYNTNPLHSSIKNLNQQMYDAYSKLWDALYPDRAIYPKVWEQVQPLYNNYFKVSRDQYDALLGQGTTAFNSIWQQYNAIKDSAIGARDSAWSEYTSRVSPLNDAWSNYTTLVQMYNQLFSLDSSQTSAWNDLDQINNQRWQVVGDAWRDYFVLKNSWDDWVGDTDVQIATWGKIFTDSQVETPKASNKSTLPLIGIVDTGFSATDPDIDYTRIQLGSDRVGRDNNPLLSSEEWWRDQHGTKILEIIAGTRNNDIGIDGINDKSPLWLSSAVGSDDWAQSLIEFVDHVKASNQSNAVINLSFDLTQINPDGTVSTRYALTPLERAALTYAQQHHVLIVTSTGNQGDTMSALAQATKEFDNILVVGAAEGWQKAPYSSYGQVDYDNYGKGVDLLAQGTADNGATGTSVAAAKVTGAVSLIWAANPALNYLQVIDILKRTATDLNTPNWDTQTGLGLLNIEAAIRLAQATIPQTYKPANFDLVQNTLTAYGMPATHEADFYQLYTTYDIANKLTGAAWDYSNGTIASERATRWKENGIGRVNDDWVYYFKGEFDSEEAAQNFINAQIKPSAYSNYIALPPVSLLGINNWEVYFREQATRERKWAQSYNDNPASSGPRRSTAWSWAKNYVQSQPQPKEGDPWFYNIRSQGDDWGGTVIVELITNLAKKAEIEKLQAVIDTAQKKVGQAQKDIIAEKTKADSEQKRLKADLDEIKTELAKALQETGGQVTPEIAALQSAAAAKQAEIDRHQQESNQKIAALEQKLAQAKGELAQGKQAYAAAVAETQEWRQEEMERIRRDQAAAMKGMFDRLADNVKSFTKDLGENLKGALQGIDVAPVLDALRKIPVVGTVVNGIEGLIAMLEGDWIEVAKKAINAALDLIPGGSAIPEPLVNISVNVGWALVDKKYDQALAKTLKDFQVEPTLADTLVGTAWALKDGDWKTALNNGLSKAGFDHADKFVQMAWSLKDDKDNQYEQAFKTGLTLTGFDATKVDAFVNISSALKQNKLNQELATVLTNAKVQNAQQIAQILSNSNPNDDQAALTQAFTSIGFQNAANWVGMAWDVKAGNLFKALSIGFGLVGFNKGQQWTQMAESLKNQQYDKVLETGFQLSSNPDIAKQGGNLVKIATSLRQGNYVDAVYAGLSLVPGLDSLIETFKAIQKTDFKAVAQSLPKAALALASYF